MKYNIKALREESISKCKHLYITCETFEEFKRIFNMIHPHIINDKDYDDVTLEEMYEDYTYDTGIYLEYYNNEDIYKVDMRDEDMDYINMKHLIYSSLDVTCDSEENPLDYLNKLLNEI